MATTNRLFQDFISFTVDTDPGSGGLSLSGPGLADLLVVADPDFIALTLDPEEVNGDSEIIWVSVHSSAATTATIVREQEGTTGRAHPIGTVVVAGVTAVGIGTLPGFDFQGVRAGRSGSAFSIASGSDVAVEWNAETFDSDAFHDNSTNPTRLTVPSGLGGKYAVHGLLLMPGAAVGSGGTGRHIRIRKNGTTSMATSLIPVEAADVSIISMSIEIYSLVDLAATDYVELMGQQDTGGTVDVTGDNTVGAFFEMHLVGV
ncbi:hypothetical protein LCGC14_2142830 [marine sediment metagenome]|uniref:Uncharacterized protein n=1 Tax=marine sediment metagenome TaxID=412755 RepID=A0A0F9GU32_9ZZZZ